MLAAMDRIDGMHPTPDQLARLGATDDDGPVVMLNLVKFRERSLDGDGSGEDAYLHYSRGTMPLIKARGGTIIWSGRQDQVAIGDDAGDDWDLAILVSYPSRAAFIDMMTSDDYAAVNPHRLNGLAKHVILATTTQYAKLKDAGA